jgi:protease IV
VDSPGGEVLASDEISQAIKHFQETSGKPVVASFGGLAASGGYYVSAPCRYIVAHELTITGSIGVIMHSWNYRGLMNKVGVRPEVFKSGRFKDMLSGERDEAAVPVEERAMIQTLIDQTYTRFKRVVSEGRREAEVKNQGDGRALVRDWEAYADGRILSGRQAYDCGFVDELGDFEAAVKRAKKLAGVAEAQLIRYEQPFDLSSLFRIFGKTEAPALKIDWGADLPKIQTGRLYFLSSTLMH